MANKIIPTTKKGKWSVGLNIFFLFTIAISVSLVKIFKVLSFDDIWWDITVNVFLAPIIGLALGIAAIKKDKDNLIWIRLSLGVSILSILFILLHSLFIGD